MSADSATVPVKPGSRGRLYFWAGLGLCVLGVALVVAQYSLRQLIVPWYLPVLTTAGALLLLWSVVQRRTVARFVALGLVGVLAGLQWFFLGSLARLPEYTGPARVGEPIPAFRTTLATGRPFTNRDLADGTQSVLIFFRGRW